MAQMIQINLDDLDEDIRDLILASGKLCTRDQAIRKAVLDAFDPIIPLGPPFEFETRDDDPKYLSLMVPPPYADCDLAVCWKMAQLDANAVSLILDGDAGSMTS